MTRTFVMEGGGRSPFALNLERDLNEPQRAAVTCGDGPKLVIAGAGSGKTRTITYRVAWLMAKGVPAGAILLATFTNKAAREMLSRVEALTGSAVGKVWGGTFHAIGNRLLRHYATLLGYSPSYSILDEEDQRDLLKVCVTEARIKTEEQRFPSPAVLQDLISFAFNTQQPVSAVIERLFPHFLMWTDAIQAIDARYAAKKRGAQAMDYDDLLRYWLQLLRDHPEVAQRLGGQFRYLLVDEYQDTNIVQAEIIERLSGHNGRNLMVVGDDSQCVMQGTRILTLKGYRAVETLKVGDLVLAGAGNGRLIPERIRVIRRSQHQRYLVIRVQGGYTLRASPNHLCFAKVVPQQKRWYVYLMYRTDLGFRIGVSHISRRSPTDPGHQMRTTAEQADKLWVLEAHRSRQEAQYRETILSLKYQIPQTIFRSDLEIGGKSKMTKTQLVALFHEFGQNGYRLLEDRGLQFERPSFEPKASRSNRRIAINLIMGSAHNGYDRRSQQVHEVVCESYLGWEVARHFPVVRHKDGFWRLRKQNRDYSVVLGMARELEHALAKQGYQVSTHYKARFVSAKEFSGTFREIPAAGLVPGLVVPVVRDGRIVAAEVESVDWKDNATGVPFYDLEVEQSHNVVSEGIVTHNSIYAFRGAHYDNILKFPDRNPGTEIFKLEINYRSTPQILSFTNASIHHNTRQHRKTLTAMRTSGPMPAVVPISDVYQEASFVAQRILQLRDEGVGLEEMAVLYRAHAHSTILQAELIRRNIPYEIRSGIRFFEQAHIKDVVAYLKVLANPFDEIAWRRLFLMLPRVGNVTAARLWEAIARTTDPREAVLGAELLTVLPANARPPFTQFQRDLRLLRQTAQEQPPSVLVSAVLDTGYLDYLRARYEAAQSRMEDIEQLAVFAKPYRDLNGLLSELILLGELYGQDVAAGPAADRERIILSSVHQAKGLEWRVVFVIRICEGGFPSTMALRERDGEEEERRIFYVAATRAKDELYLVHPLLEYGTRGSGGTLLQPSRFLQEIPFTLYDQAEVEELPQTFPLQGSDPFS